MGSGVASGTHKHTFSYVVTRFLYPFLNFLSVVIYFYRFISSVFTINYIFLLKIFFLFIVDFIICTF